MLGAFFMIVAMTLLPVGDAAGKYLAGVAPYGPVSMAWFRFAVGAALLAPVAVFWLRETRFDRFFVLSQLLRGVLLTSAIALILTAVTLIPMADAFGAFFIGPAVSTLLARFVLREHVSRWEWASLALGFIGVLLVTQPNAGLQFGTICGLGAGCAYGAFLTATRWAASTAPPVMTLLSQLVIGATLLAPFGAPQFLQHGIVEPVALGWLALPSVIANLLAIVAYRLSRAGALAPFVYAQIISAAVTGYLLFGEVPGTVAALGLALILGSGLLLLWRVHKT